MRARKCPKTRKLLIGSPLPPPLPILAVGRAVFFSLSSKRRSGGGRSHKTLELGLSISNSRGGGGEGGGLGSFISRPFCLLVWGERKRCHLQIGFREKSNVEKNEIFFPQRRNYLSKGLNSGTVTSADNLDLFIDISKTPCFPAKFWDLFSICALGADKAKTKCIFFPWTCLKFPDPSSCFPHPHSIADGPFGGKSGNDRTNSICRKILLQRDNNRI